MVVSATAEFQAWAKSRTVGCQYARAMLSAPADYGIILELVPTGSVSELAAGVKEQIARHIAAPMTEGLVLAFEQAISESQLAEVVRHLIATAGWHPRVEYLDREGEEFAIVGLDVHVGEDAGYPVLAELVVFAPFDYLPPTRRAPVAAIALRTKPELSDTPLPGRPERRANLAAIKMELPTRAFNKLWDQSIALRKEINGENETLVRARVALPFRRTVWDSVATRAM